MSQKSKFPSNLSNATNSPELTPEIIKQFIDNQAMQAKNEAASIALREKEMEINARLAEKSMDYQAEYMNKRSSESRKTITRFAWIIGGFALIFLIFLLVLLYLGHKDFAGAFLHGLSYLVVSVLSFFAGKKLKNKVSDGSSNQDIEDAEVIK